MSSPGSARPAIVAYSSRLSVASGDRVPCMVSCFGPTEYEARLVRIVRGDQNPAGPGPMYETVNAVPVQRRLGRIQAVHGGSFAVLPSPTPWRLSAGVSLQATIWPTTPEKGRQAVLSLSPDTGHGLVQLGIGAGGHLVLHIVAPDGTAHNGRD